MNKKLLCAAACVHAFFVSAPEASADVNLMVNGSFEGEYGWVKTSGPTTSIRSTAAGRSKDGRYSLKLADSSTSTTTSWKSVDVPVVAGVHYTTQAEAWRASGHAALVYVRYFDSSGTQLASTTGEANGTSGAWQSLKIESVAPVGAVSARVILHSLGNRTTVTYFDNIEFVRAETQSFVDNPDFELDAIEPGLPRHWSLLGSGQPVSVTADPLDAQNRVMRLVDTSTSTAAGASSTFEVSPGIRYEASTLMYLATNSDAAKLFLKFYDEDGAEVGSSFVSGASTTGVWQVVSTSALAPAEARTAAVLAYCGMPSRCDARFDYVTVFEDWSTGVYYVAPEEPDESDGSGATESNAAFYNDSNLWVTIENELASRPVKVVFLGGDYQVKTELDRLKLLEYDDVDHRLVLEAKSRFGTVFRRMDPDTGNGPLLQLEDCSNLSVRNLRFIGSINHLQSLGGVVEVESTNGALVANVSIEGVAFSDFPRLEYGGVNIKSGPYADGGVIENARLWHVEAIRAGSAAGYHHVYAAGNFQDFLVDSSYFEDASGAYVKLRAQHNDTTVENCHFYSSGTYFNDDNEPDQAFVQLRTNPGTEQDEWYGTGYRIRDNILTYGNSSSCATSGCKAFSLSHVGPNPNLDPPDPANERKHLDLLSTKSRLIMGDTSTGNIGPRRDLLAVKTELVIDNCSLGICFSGNQLTGHTAAFSMWFSDDVSQTATYDISNLASY